MLCSTSQGNDKWAMQKRFVFIAGRYWKNLCFNRMPGEFDFVDGYKFEKPFYGLYTCASNSVYIPNNLMKPTDFNGAIRNLLFRKAESLYGACSNLVPPYVKPKNIYDSDKWNIVNFEWAEPVGTLDNISAFLEFRQERLKKIFETGNF